MECSGPITAHCNLQHVILRYHFCIWRRERVALRAAVVESRDCSKTSNAEVRTEQVQLLCGMKFKERGRASFYSQAVNLMQKWFGVFLWVGWRNRSHGHRELGTDETEKEGGTTWGPATATWKGALGQAKETAKVMVSLWWHSAVGLQKQRCLISDFNDFHSM